MKSQILFLALALATVSASLTASTECVCGELTTSADCASAGCYWNTTTSVCAATCTGFTTQAACDAVSGCAWGSSCAAFTACADYTQTSTSTQDLCYLKDSTCAPGTANSDGTVPCATGTVTCSSISDSTVCTGLSQSDGSLCYYQNSACTAYTVSTCSGITDSTVCAFVGCTYASSACAAPTCAGYTAQADCTYARSDAVGSVTLCAWDSTNSVCADASDTTTLTSSTCYSNSAGTYAWLNSACTACTGTSTTTSTSTSNSVVLSVIAILAVLVL